METIPPSDITVLRRLAEEQAKIASIPVHKKKADLWRHLNQRQPVRPLVWINEICWNENNVDDELTLRSFLNQARGLSIEIILKDISTVRNDLYPLWDWERVCMRLVQ